MGISPGCNHEAPTPSLGFKDERGICFFCTLCLEIFCQGKIESKLPEICCSLFQPPGLLNDHVIAKVATEILTRSWESFGDPVYLGIV